MPPIIISKPAQVVPMWYNKDGKLTFIKADGIFQRVISHRKNVYRVAKILSNTVTYLVREGDKWAHGDTFTQARESLVYKISNRDTSRYKSMTGETSLTHAEAIECYRIITGACESGSRNYVENILNGMKKDKYIIAEIATLTKGQYGNDLFAKFFGI